MDDKMGDPIDAELLAMLLEGRLSEPEKAELLARLANSDDTLEALGDAATLSLEMETELREVSENWRKKQESTLRMEAPSGEMSEGARAESGTTVVSADELQRKRKERRGKIWLWTPFVGLAAAAMIAILVNRSSGPDGPLAIADLLPRDSLAAALAGDTPVVGVRGEPKRDAREFGMNLVKLAAAVSLGNTAKIESYAEAAQRLTSDKDAIQALQQIRDTPTASKGRLRELLETAEGGTVSNEEDALLGAWVQGARLAAATEDTAFFTRSDWQKALEDIEVIDDGEAAGSAQAVRNAQPPGAPIRWPDLRSALEDLARDLTEPPGSSDSR